jgi:2-polyprenyl-3-methyl-5-hydroxy-6-metoxy-1,4-benzoquinol methylase
VAVAEQRLEDLLARLERERLDADRLYNEALTAVDRAMQVVPSLPDPPPPFDPSRLPEVNARWDILPGGPPPVDRSWKGRLRGFIWRLVGPPLETQKQFNAALVDHLNRNLAVQQEWPRRVASLIEVARREFEALVCFESLLVQYLQTITIYIDSKDRSVGGSELSQRFALTEQRVLALKRDVENLPIARSSPDVARRPAARAQDGRPEPFNGPVDSLTYVGFEDRFRGSPGEVRARVQEYVSMLASASDVVDIGCGRGELLGALRDQGVTARGVDINQAMVELCRSHGLEVEQDDALAFLAGQRDGGIGGLVAVQVVEHFEPGYLTRFLEAAYHKMRPGAPLILETVNPACWMAFFETYIRDLTHQRPLHPDTLRYLVQASGFSKVDVQFRRPVSDGDRLERVAPPARPPREGSDDVAKVAAALNANADKLNARLFSSMDYVVIARK